MMRCPNCKTWMQKVIVVDKYGDRTIIWTCPLCGYVAKEFIA
jgi:uncharacterized Zn finger protein